MMLKLFFNGKDRLIVGEDCLFDLLDEFMVVLDRALQNKAHLIDESITENIGYVWNRELHGEEGLQYEDSFWVGLDNYVWGAPGNIQPNFSVWLYNDSLGNIILEITENYFWHHLDLMIGKNYITYEEFMAQYRPYFIRHIPREIAEQWLKDAKDLFAKVQENDRLEL